MAFVRSARVLGDGKPVLTGVGARVTRRGLRVDVLYAAARVRAGKVRLSLHAGGRPKHLTIVLAEGLEPGAYETTTLEVVRDQ